MRVMHRNHSMHASDKPRWRTAAARQAGGHRRQAGGHRTIQRRENASDNALVIHHCRPVACGPALGACCRCRLVSPCLLHPLVACACRGALLLLLAPCPRRDLLPPCMLCVLGGEGEAGEGEAVDESLGQTRRYPALGWQRRRLGLAMLCLAILSLAASTTLATSTAGRLRGCRLRGLTAAC